MRAFVAIELPFEVRRSLRDLLGMLSRAFEGGRVAHTVRWTAIEGIHLTLRFLGETGDVEHERLARRLQTITRGCHPFTLTLGGLGCFPNLRRPSVIWVGVRGDMESLRALQSPIEIAARDEGFEPEVRAFSPHLTLGRLRRETPPADLARAGELVQVIAQDSAVLAWNASIPVDGATFFQSDLRPTGAVYTPLDRFPLWTTDD